MSEKTQKMLPIGSTIGIIGGGQLGRMLALSAAQLGMKTIIFCPDENSPAFDVTPNKIIAPYDDENALTKFANSCDIITFEFENLPAKSIKFLESISSVSPDSRALFISQDRIKEKEFLLRSDINIASFAPVNSIEDLEKAYLKIGPKAVLKTTRMGYDGKGQRIVSSLEMAKQAYEELKNSELVLEKFIPFEREISVVIARNKDGQVRDFDPAENIHENHILKTSTIPANIDNITAKRASRIAQQIVGSLNYVGVLGVEFFITSADPKSADQNPILLVNEIAPRVHNSGHWTQAGCITDQFEQHIRAICNWPLGDPTRYCDVVMENLIGDEIIDAHKNLKSGVQPHFYGKKQIREGRKMAHLNIVTK